MGRLINSLRLRLLGAALVIHAVGVPLLYAGVTRIVTDGYAELFLNSARSYSQLVADTLESSRTDDFERRSQEVLDSVLLSGQVVFAEIIDGSNRIRSSLPAPAQPPGRRDDFKFGEQPDEVYYISHTIKRSGKVLVLRMGFDEGPTHQQIGAAEQRVLTAMLAFTAVSIGMAIWLSAAIARPMVRLQDAAKLISRGEFDVQLAMKSSVREVQELGRHLEDMRQKLVGTNERLAREITERKSLEAERLNLERRLLHRERIATIGTLAGGIAHEFNNIMTPILLYSQVALHDVPADSSVARDLARIIAAAHRARSLVTGILTFSREVDLQQAVVFSLHPTVEEAVGLLRAIVPANIEITLVAEELDLPVCGDPSLLHQVVVNLCTNAYQAMRHHGGKITVRVAAVQDPQKAQLNPGRYVLLEVIDTGHGMEEAVLAHIFEPFFTTREVGEGTGLGLSIVHGIVTSMSGSITVESTVGRGTTVHIYLPAAEDRPNQQALADGAA